MKKRFLLAAFVMAAWALPKGNTQCIGDISYLISSPKPCFYMGSVDASKLECFDPFTFFMWKYTWKIRGADDGKLIAIYDGMIFQHTFKKFGGYEFTLEIDKDGKPQTPPDIQETITYTTCEPCGKADIEVDYLNCPEGAGCSVKLTASMEAVNAVGLLPDAKFIVTYYPTSNELNGGSGAYDLEFPDIDVNYNPQTGLITVSEDLVVPYERGCFKPRLEFGLEYGAGSKEQGSNFSCQQVDLFGKYTFRCIACTFGDGDCKASLKANEVGGCEPFSCIGLRGEEEDASGETVAKSRFLAGPNPASNTLHIEQPASSRERVILMYDAFGKQVKYLVGMGHQNIDLTDVSNGMYHLLITEEGKPVFSEKIVVAK